MTAQEDKIHIIVTGGTIDSKFHAPTESSLVKTESGIPKFLTEIIQPYFNFSFEQVCMVDSSDISDEIRDKIFQSIRQTTCTKILITHGTNTMSETLSYLSEKLSNPDKTVVITGAMIPLEGISPTDSGFNLGFAIAKLLELPSGVYLSMNGKIFRPNEVKKNFDIARFEEK